MDTVTKIVSYGVGKYILIPIFIAICAGIWAFLKEQKEELPKKIEKYKQEKIKNDYRKELEREELIKKLKNEVREEMKNKNKW